MESKTSEYPPCHIYELMRPQFFSDLQKVAPEVINELNQKPLDGYTRYCLAFVKYHQAYAKSVKFCPEFPGSIYEAYYQSLREWAEVHRLDETYWEENPDWVFMQARIHLEGQLDHELRELYNEYNFPRKYMKRIEADFDEFYNFSDTRERFLNEIIESDSLDGIGYLELWPKLIFKNYGWNPFEEQRSDAVERLTGEFKEYLQKYLDKMEDACRRRNIPPVPADFRRKPQVDRHRFEWLIRFHVQGWSKSKIAQTYGVDRKAVQVSIAKEARWVGLIPRQ
jgi:hypothetical protein